MPRRAVLLALAAPVLPFALALGLIVTVAWDMDAHAPGTADAAIVLGAAVAGDAPSPVFAGRIRHGVTLYREGRVPLLVMTGGLGKGGRLTEAEAARDWAMARGVPGEAILLETASRTTLENFACVLPLLRSHNLRRVLVVSDPPHMRRAVTMARDLGIDAAPAPTPDSRYVSTRRRAGFVLTEAYYFAKYMVERIYRGRPYISRACESLNGSDIGQQ